MMPQTLILRYASFAVIATVANLASQRAILRYDESVKYFSIAMVTGTIVGLVIKYCLDKHWIFYDLATDVKSHRQKFLLYTATGVVTTAIFWGIEALFWSMWQTDLMRELGAVVGLSIGYFTKYNLDKRYVFMGCHSVAAK